MKATTNFHLAFQQSTRASASPYRLLDGLGGDVAWVNEFLDLQHIRGLSPRSVRTYGYDLLHFARWWAQAAPGPLSELNESTLLDYVRYQLDQHPKPTAQTINHRLTALRNLYRFHYQREIPSRNRFLKHFCYPQPLRLRKAGHACGWPAIEGASTPRGSSLVPAGRRVLAQLSHFSRPQLPSTLFKPAAGLLRRPDGHKSPPTDP